MSTTHILLKNKVKLSIVHIEGEGVWEEREKKRNRKTDRGEGRRESIETTSIWVISLCRSVK